MDETRNRSSLALGFLLIAAGVVLFLGQYFGWSQWGELWPLMIAGVGLFFFVAMLAGGKSLGGLAIPGSIISMVGLILWFQNTFNAFETWSYAWALIIVAIGIGLIIYGKWSDRPDEVKGGLETLRVGVVLFLVFGALMEFIFSLTGVTQGRGVLIFPALLTLLGLATLVSNIIRVARRDDDHRERNLFWPVLLTGLGALWTLSALGWLPVQQVSALLNLWPLLLIAAGLDLAFGRRSPWSGFVLGVLLVAILFGLVAFGPRLGIRLSPAWNLGENYFAGEGLLRETIDGSGTIQHESRAASGVRGLRVSTSGIVEVVVGDQEGVEITADDNLLPYLETDVRNGILVIQVRRGYAIRPTDAPAFIVYVRSLESIDVSGSGSLGLDNLTGERLEVNSSGSTRMELHNLDLSELVIDISGSGDVTAEGQAGELRVGSSGAGNFTGDGLQVREARIDISGASDVALWVLERLDIEISGAGRVSYYGSPQVSQDVSGSGKVEGLGEK